MKPTAQPTLHVSADLLEAAEGVLREGETLSGFLENAIREHIRRRQEQALFMARGVASQADARSSGQYHSAQAVHAELQLRLDERRSFILG